MSSEICRGCSFPDPAAEPLRPAASGSDVDVTPFVSGSLELMSPELPLPGSPRLFVSGEVGGAFGIDRKVAREGNPGNIQSPLPPSDTATNFTEDGALGQGSQVTAARDGPTYGARAGVAFPFELFGRPLRVRTSVAWMRYGIDLEGQVSDAACLRAGATTRCNANGGGFLREVNLSASTDETFDAIGPGIDLELQTGRWGPIGHSIQIGAHAMRVLGDTEVDFASPVVVVDDVLGTDEHRAFYGFEVDEWIIRAGVGFRLQWLGSAP